MIWKKEIKQRFYSSGIDAFTHEEQNFLNLLAEWLNQKGIILSEALKSGDLLPEGASWFLKIQGGEDLFIQKSSLSNCFENKDIKYLWIEFDSEKIECICEVHYYSDKESEVYRFKINNVEKIYP